MTRFRRQFLVKLFTLSDLAIMAGSFVLAGLPESYLGAHVSFTSFLSMRIKLQNAIVFVAVLAVWHGVFAAIGLYQSKRLENRRNELTDVVKATSIGTLALLVAGILFRIRMTTPLFLVSFWCASTSITVASRLFLRPLLSWIRIHGRNLRRILIVGTNQRAIRFARSVESKPELGYELVGFVDEDWPGREEFRASGYPIVADCHHFPQLLREHVVDEVMLALPMRSCYQQALSIATMSREQGVIVHFLTNIFELGSPHSTGGDDFDPEAAMTVSSHPSEGWPSVVKSLLDFAIAAAALVVLAPLFLITAILIRWETPGRIFFVQERVGLNKRRFPMYKFRTMIDGAERMQTQLELRNEADGPVFKIKDDPRVTRVGRFLRKFSIDELPQLINVLRGDMSLVGPRPLPVRDYQGFDQDRQRRRFSVRPGLTCLWQIKGRSEVSFDHWMELDMQYIDHWSLWLDLKILVKTIPAVLRGTGAA
jgi:exopolysaccharide biosynthesis polyprenyl glycosylphosphotransferase